MRAHDGKPVNHHNLDQLIRRRDEVSPPIDDTVQVGSSHDVGPSPGLACRFDDVFTGEFSLPARAGKCRRFVQHGLRVFGADDQVATSSSSFFGFDSGRALAAGGRPCNVSDDVGYLCLRHQVVRRQRLGRHVRPHAWQVGEKQDGRCVWYKQFCEIDGYLGEITG